MARAAADGSVLLLDASSFAVNSSLFPKLPYDSATAFTPLAVLDHLAGLHAGVALDDPA